MWIVAVAMSDPSGQLAGLVLNAFSVQAFCSVVRRAGSCLGSCRRTLATFACATPVELTPPEVTVTVRLAPSALLVLAWVLAVKAGRNGRF